MGSGWRRSHKLGYEDTLEEDKEEERQEGILHLFTIGKKQESFLCQTLLMQSVFVAERTFLKLSPDSEATFPFPPNPLKAARKPLFLLPVLFFYIK